MKLYKYLLKIAGIQSFDLESFLAFLAGHRHQIRVHLASCGHPILGDDAYHGQPWGIRGTCHRTLGSWNGEW